MMQERKMFRDATTGRWLTQSLFLEIGYKPQALYTLKDDDHEYKGKVYPSIKKLYMECNDPTEYTVATKHFGGLQHWLRIADNKMIAEHINAWRYELELKMRCEGIRNAAIAAEKGNWQAAKWFASRGWESKGAGRPSKDAIKRQQDFESKAAAIVKKDHLRLIGED